MGILINRKFEKCPKCGGRLKQGVPRFGPEKVVCGHCKTEINTNLKTWASLSGGQKGWKAFWELFAPSYFGTYASIAGLILLVVNIAFVVFVPVGLGMLALLARGSDALEMVVLGLGELFMGCLYVYYYPLKHLRKEIASSNAYTSSNATPVWSVGETRDWPKIALYAAVAFIVGAIVLAIIIVSLSGT